jgi:hypothetical protein
MRNVLKNRKALSTVVTTLIILVVSVLLAGVVTYFAINVTSTRVQEESLNIMYQHVWYNTPSTGTGQAEAAMQIVNTGGRDVVLQNIAVRGQPVDFGTIYYNNTPVTSDLLYANNSVLTNTDPTKYYGIVYTKGTTGTSLVLKSGDTLVIYMISPDSITINDVGLTVAISVFTAQATYYKETNVQASNSATN